MKNKFLILFFNIFLAGFIFSITAEDIIKKIDNNLNFNTAIMTVRLEIYMPQQPLRIKKFKAYIQGTKNSYVEFLNLEDKHIRYLKLGKKMWLYDKEENNSFLISGHLLKQGIVGSDISYEDALESDEIYKKYDIELLDEEKYGGKECYVILLTSKVKQVNYYKRKMWVDKEYFIPLKEERYTKNNKLLKIFESYDIKFYDGKAYPTKNVVCDALKVGSKTVVFMEEIQFNVDIPSRYFTKRHLER